MNLKSVGVALFIGLWVPALTATDGIDPLFSARQTLSGEWESFEKLALQPLRTQLELAPFDRREEKVMNWPQGVLGVRVVTPQTSWQDEKVPGLWQKIQALNPKAVRESNSPGEQAFWQFMPLQLDARKVFWLSRFDRGSEFQFLVDRSAFGAWERLKVLLPAGVWLITQDYRIVFPDEYFAQTLEAYPFQVDAQWEGEWQGKKLMTRAVRLAGTNLLFLYLQSPSGLPIKKLALLLGIGFILAGLSWFIWWYRNQAKKPQSSQSLSPLLSPAAPLGTGNAVAASEGSPNHGGQDSLVTSLSPKTASPSEKPISDQSEGPLALLLKQLQLWQFDMSKYNVEWQSEDRILERVLSQWRLKPEQFSQNLGLFYPGREWLWPQELLTRLIRLFLPQEITSAKLQVQGVDEGHTQKIRVELMGEPAAWLKDPLDWRYSLPETWGLHWHYEPAAGSGRLVIDFTVRHRLPQGLVAVRASDLLKDGFIDKLIEQLEEPIESESIFQALSEDPLAQPNPHQRLSLDTARLKKVKTLDFDTQNLDLRPPKEKNS